MATPERGAIQELDKQNVGATAMIAER